MDENRQSLSPHCGAAGDQEVGVRVRVGWVHPAPQGVACSVVAVPPAHPGAEAGGCRSAGKGRAVVDVAGGGGLCREVARGAGTTAARGSVVPAD